MEIFNYNSIQSILDAFKAEYVNARNLKKSVNSKKRTARNAASFNNRKDNESTVLETRIDAIESSVDSTLSTAIDTLDSVKFTDLHHQLSSLKGKLNILYAETDRLASLSNIDPEIYNPFTSREIQAHVTLRSLLENAIYEAETAINELYTGTDYSTIKNVVMPNSLNSDTDVVVYYNSLISKFDLVKDQLGVASYDYTKDLFETVAEINARSQECLGDSKYLVHLKSDLADMLSNEATQSEIDQQELAIENHKEYMIIKANELKAAWVKFDSFIGTGSQSNKFTKLIKLSETLEDIYDEILFFRGANYEKIRGNSEFFAIEHYSAKAILNTFTDVFNRIEERALDLFDINIEVGPLNYSSVSRVGAMIRRDVMMQEDSQKSASDSVYNTIINNNIFDRSNSNKLKNDVSDTLLSQYVTYTDATTPVTLLTEAYATRDAKIQMFNEYIVKMESEIPMIAVGITEKYKNARRNWQDLDNQYQNMNLGYWTGTEEQNQQWETLYQSIYGEGGLIDTKIENQLDMHIARSRYSLLGMQGGLGFGSFYDMFMWTRGRFNTAQSAYLELDPPQNSDDDLIGEAFNLLDIIYYWDVTWVNGNPIPNVPEGYISDNSLFTYQEVMVLNNSDYAAWLEIDINVRERYRIIATKNLRESELNNLSSNPGSLGLTTIDGKIPMGQQWRSGDPEYNNYMLENNLGFTFDGEPIYSLTGQELFDFWTNFWETGDNVTSANQALNDALAELEALQGQMTRSIPTEMDKRDKIKIGGEAEHARIFLLSLEYEFNTTIEQLFSSAGSNIQGLVWSIEDLNSNTIPQITTSVMQFIKGNNNVVYNSVFSRTVAENKLGFHFALDWIEKNNQDAVAVFPPELFQSFSYLSKPENNNQTSILQGISYFTNGIAEYAETRHIVYPRSISDSIINEVENGGSPF